MQQENRLINSWLTMSSDPNQMMRTSFVWPLLFLLLVHVLILRFALNCCMWLFFNYTIYDTTYWCPNSLTEMALNESMSPSSDDLCYYSNVCQICSFTWATLQGQLNRKQETGSIYCWSDVSAAEVLNRWCLSLHTLVSVKLLLVNTQTSAQ